MLIFTNDTQPMEPAGTLTSNMEDHNQLNKRRRSNLKQEQDILWACQVCKEEVVLRTPAMAIGVKVAICEGRIGVSACNSDTVQQVIYFVIYQTKNAKRLKK